MERGGWRGSGLMYLSTKWTSSMAKSIVRGCRVGEIWEVRVPIANRGTKVKYVPK